MPHLLHLDSSADRVHSRTRQITAAFAEAWRQQGDEFHVTYRDLSADPLPHLPDADLHWPERLRPDGAEPPAAACELQGQLIDELCRADVLLVGAPMYNYSVPSSLKAWIDYIHVPGQTSPFDAKTQPMAGRPAVIATARGASSDPEAPTGSWDYGTKMLEAILGNSLGMEIQIIATSLTLADSIEFMADFRQRSHDELSAALEAARASARHLAVQLSGEMPQTN